MLFPELGLSAYAIDDLLLQDALLDAVETQLAQLVDVSKALPVRRADPAPRTLVQLRHRGLTRQDRRRRPEIVPAFRVAEWSEGSHRGQPVAARRLAGAVRWQRKTVARRARAQCSRLTTATDEMTTLWNG
jgi:hypothetical protein